MWVICKMGIGTRKRPCAWFWFGFALRCVALLGLQLGRVEIAKAGAQEVSQNPHKTKCS